MMSAEPSPGPVPVVTVTQTRCGLLVNPNPVVFLLATLLMTISATAMLCAAIMTDHWEHVTWDRGILERLNNRSEVKLEWLLDGEVARIPLKNRKGELQTRGGIFLVPMHGGIWTLCVNLNDLQMRQLAEKGFPRPTQCLNYLAGINSENARGEETRADWQHSESSRTTQVHRQMRMQNLSISCSLVCLIILGSAALVGAFGVCQRQLSAILVTGVMYLLAGLFALFTLMIIHFKRQQGKPMLDSTYDGTIDGVVTAKDHIYAARSWLGARVFTTDWSLDLGWGGVVLCALTSFLWIWLSKLMRWNPLSAMLN